MKLLFILILFFTNIFASQYGQLLFQGNCVTCHYINEKKSAPSIIEVKEHYITAFPIEKDFVDYMSTWILRPSEKMSIMQHSIDEFGLMPELAYDEYTLKEIAKYIYKTDFSKLK